MHSVMHLFCFQILSLFTNGDILDGGWKTNIQLNKRGRVTFWGSIKVAINGIQLGKHLKLSHLLSELRVQLVVLEWPIENPLLSGVGV